MIYYPVNTDALTEPADISIVQSDSILVKGDTNQSLLAVVSRHNLGLKTHITIDGVDYPGRDPAFYMFEYGNDAEDFSEILQCHSIISLYDQILANLEYVKNDAGGHECVTPREFILGHRDILENNPYMEWYLYRVSVYAGFISFVFHKIGTGDCFEIMRLKTPMWPDSRLDIEMPINGELGYAWVQKPKEPNLHLSITTPTENETLISVNINNKILPAIRMIEEGDGITIQKFYPLDTIQEEQLEHLLAIKDGYLYW